MWKRFSDNIYHHIHIYILYIYMQCITMQYDIYNMNQYDYIIDCVYVMYTVYLCSICKHPVCNKRLVSQKNSQRHTAARTIAKEHLGVRRHRPLWRIALDLFKGMSVICRCVALSCVMDL